MRALCLPGCACRGAFQAGVLARMAARGERFDLVLGASSGSITGATTVAGLAEAAPDMWRSMAQTPVVSARYLLTERSPFGMSHILRGALERFVPEHHVAGAETELLIATAHATKLVRSVFGRRPLDHSLVVHSTRARRDVHDLIVASCYIPIIYARVPRIDGEVHVDGGAADNTLIDVALARGATDITVVTPYPEGAVSRTMFSPERTPTAPAHVRLRLIFPEQRLRQKRFDFEPAALEEALSAREVVRVVEARPRPRHGAPS